MQGSKFVEILCILLLVGLGNVQSVSSHREARSSRDPANLLSPPFCGHRGNVSSRRVIDGVLSKRSAWPWIALLANYEKETDLMTFFCGGTLISERHIVTAAHCFARGIKLHAFARLGISDFRNQLRDSLDIPISKAYIHPHFNASFHQNDVAVLKLDRDVTFTDSVHPICLPTVSTKLNRRSFAGETAILAGWGALQFESYMSDSLREAKLKVLSIDECEEATKRIYRELKIERPSNDKFSPDMICAGNERKNSCMGDSGGPLMYFDGVNYYLIGIVSHGHRCGNTNTPGTYMRVTSYVDFILANMD